MKIKEEVTTPIEGQKPGTSGLRKKTSEFSSPNYLANFIQSLFDALPETDYKGGTLLIGGDGRYYNKEAIQIVVDIAAANGVAECWIGQHGLLSTPAASAVVRERRNGVCFGCVLLTASHNPGGREGDFGVKYNTHNGGPATDSLTNLVYEKTQSIERIKRCEEMKEIDLSVIGKVEVVPGEFTVEVIDPVADWLKVMQRVFDLKSIETLMRRSDFTMVFDAMHGVAGPYAKALFVDRLHSPPSSLINCEPSEDFGGGHPDPNLEYAKELVGRMGLLPASPPAEPEEGGDVSGQAEGEGEGEVRYPSFGVAADGDADRNMILGERFFVTPSDSVAIIASYAQQCIPYFKGSGIKGLSRSMPTSRALDFVAKKLHVEVYEVPTGWKYFGNLMDTNQVSICGEESFGTGSDHVREKDGLWASLAWLSILSHVNKSRPEGELMGVREVVERFWSEFGRCYYSRYDYEGVSSEGANQMMERLREGFGNLQSISKGNVVIAQADDFTYTDPVDQCVASRQGIRYITRDGSRVVWRLSGTGSGGATIRIYFERYTQEKDKLNMPVDEALKELIEYGLEVSDVKGCTGRDRPTVIT